MPLTIHSLAHFNSLIRLAPCGCQYISRKPTGQPAKSLTYQGRHYTPARLAYILRHNNTDPGFGRVVNHEPFPPGHLGCLCVHPDHHSFGSRNFFSQVEADAWKEKVGRPQGSKNGAIKDEELLADDFITLPTQPTNEPTQADLELEALLAALRAKRKANPYY